MLQIQVHSRADLLHRLRLARDLFNAGTVLVHVSWVGISSTFDGTDRLNSSGHIPVLVDIVAATIRAQTTDGSSYAMMGPEGGGRWLVSFSSAYP